MAILNPLRYLHPPMEISTAVMDSAGKGGHVGQAEPARRKGWVDRLAAVQHSAALAYVTIFILQLHRIWNIWRYHDLTSGDTSSYFVDAWRWYTTHRTDIAWSPLYTIFYGSMLSICRDAYVATTLHRVVIVLAASMLVLAVFRRLLPPSIAWLAAAWWAVLPINFNTLYEVHLFALLPIAVAWLIALRPRAGTPTRAVVLAILLLTTFLLRNEYIVSSAVFAIVCLVLEYRAGRRMDPIARTAWITRTGWTYAAALGITVGIIIGFYSNSYVRYPKLAHMLHEKHAVNMAQVFAFGYQQRHPEWTGDPWNQCGELSQQFFGTPEPTLLRMARANPRALAEHVWWNISLVPNGWQILLLNTSSGTVDPDYADQAMGFVWPKYVSYAMIAVVLMGIIVWALERKKWNEWFSARSLGWLAILATISVSPLVVITQRPRPSYFFTVGVFSMAVVGMAVWILGRRLRLGRWAWIWMLPIMLAGWAFTPLYYLPAPRPLHDDYERLAPFAKVIGWRHSRSLAGDSPVQIEYYIGHGLGTDFDYHLMFPEWKGQCSLAEFFDQKKLNVVYLNDWAIRMIRIASPTALAEFMSTGGKDGWILRAGERLPGTSVIGPDRWLLFERIATPTSGATWDPDDPQTIPDPRRGG